MKKLSRAEAIERGLTRYFTGEECKRGHISDRMTSSSQCVQCKRNSEKGRIRPPTEHIRKQAMKNYYKRVGGKFLRPPKEERVKKRKAYLAGYMRKKRKEDPLFCIRDNIRRRLARSISAEKDQQRPKIEQIIGCSMDVFRQHIERQFLPGMSWENMGEWHLDHIVPISSAKTEEGIYALNHHTNLRPLWASENLRKSNKVEHLI